MSHVSHKKILQVGYASFAKAGIQTVIMNIARGLHAEFDMDVLLTSSRPGYYDEEFQRYGTIYRVNCDVTGYGTVKRYCHYCIRPLKQFFYAYRLIKKNRYDIVHIHSGLDGGPIFLAAKVAGVKHIVAHSHRAASAIPEKRSVFSEFYRRISKKIISICATVRVGVSKDANQYLYGVKESLIINNPVELDKFLAARHPKCNSKVILVNVGRYDYQKNQMFLLDIMSALLKGGYDAQLKLVGFGEDEPLLKKAIAKLNLADSVELVSGNEGADIPRILSEADIFVFPSACEGLGIVAIEAQAAGCLCLASNIVPEETDLGLCEYFALDAGAQAWADKVIEMVNNRENYELDTVAMSRFKAENVQEDFRVFYNGLLQKPKEDLLT